MTLRRPLLPLVCAVAAALASGQLLAQSVDGSLSVRLEGWTGDGQLSDRAGLAALSLWGRSNIDFGDAGQLVGQGWLRESTRDDGAPRGRMRELYWRRDFGPATLRVGRQMLVWGRADGLNPTDNLSPRDFTLLTPEVGDQRHGNEAVSVSLPVGSGELTMAWFPKAASHTIPLPEIPGVRYVVESPPRESQWAMKWDVLGDGIDWSVSYFDGHDPWPDFNIASVSASGVEVALRNQRTRVLGADMSLVRDRVVWRAEAAWSRTQSEGPQDFLHKKPQLWFVGGGEWELHSGATLGLQLTVKRVFDFAPVETLSSPIEREVARIQTATAAQSSRYQAGLVWRLARRWYQDRLRAEASGVTLGPHCNGSFRAQLEYAITDRWTFQTGVVSAFGAQGTTFGQLERNRLAFVQLRFGIAGEHSFTH